MKKLVLLVAALVFGVSGTKAATAESVAVSMYRYGNSFIFNESGITFSVYPDGEFDFYIDNRVNVGVGGRIGNVGITFNSGFDYNPFVQYDDYGAVIQVENVPIFYDYYGRVSQIGGIDVWYRNGRVRRLGGLNVYWNGGVFSHYTGFINIYNRGYVYRPFHRWFARPAIGFCTVWNTPYRRFYNPVRYTYYRPYRLNTRRAYAQVGRAYRYNRSPRRANIYRNDRRVAVRENRGRRNDFSRTDRSVTERRATRSSNNVRRNAERTTNRNSNVRRSDVRRSAEVNTRSNRSNSVSQRTVTRTQRSTTVTKREVKRTPERRTVTRTSTTYKKPQKRSVVSNRSSNKRTPQAQKRSNTQRRTVSRSSSTKRSGSATSRSRSTRNKS
ncbi:MAG: hypothetical protein HRT65_03690 [Flavobacteriaceae bacterium]|nr:hypothetical protein [Flavobacteriaceae bacterium]